MRFLIALKRSFANKGSWKKLTSSQPQAELFAKKDGSEKSLDTFIPKSESDFAEYIELIANKLRPYEKSFHYMGLLKNVYTEKLSLHGSTQECHETFHDFVERCRCERYIFLHCSNC